ncbi:hypothetical protein E7T09_04465 [Deinococcus sp. KSM4-11]|uniref:hypothetical protein n=1 Tax=Deinococcus sp. KSM4-11 TaxID=2568654 RepID=UPI0010A562D1|nr:hypothetical protein [Deinococcus sp. KSM4-11]THF88464.1 hypothetical protein E7T09_04465 [Deinococcus sp. KSM4-11]
MKTAVSITLLLAVVSASAVGVGYLVKRHGQAAAPAAPAPSASTTPMPTIPATIAVGEPAPGAVYAGGSATFNESTGGYVLAGSAVTASPITPTLGLQSWLNFINRPITLPIDPTRISA